MFTSAAQRVAPVAASPAAPNVWLLSPGDAADFAPARQRLEIEAGRGHCRLQVHDGVVAAARRLDRLDPASGEAPDVLIVPQHQPGELDEAAINSLRRHAPLASIVVLLGHLCEGEGRSGGALQGVTRVACHPFPARWVRHRVCWQRRRLSPWMWPATWTEEDAWVAGPVAEEVATEGELGVVMSPVISETHRWLRDLCRQRDWQVIDAAAARVGQGGRCVGLWHDDQFGDAQLDELAAFVRQVQPAPVIAICGFPRPADNQRAEAAGAASLLAKPLATDDLVAEIAWQLGIV